MPKQIVAGLPSSVCRCLCPTSTWSITSDTLTVIQDENKVSKNKLLWLILIWRVECPSLFRVPYLCVNKLDYSSLLLIEDIMCSTHFDVSSDVSVSLSKHVRVSHFLCTLLCIDNLQHRKYLNLTFTLNS